MIDDNNLLPGLEIGKSYPRRLCPTLWITSRTTHQSGVYVDYPAGA